MVWRSTGLLALAALLGLAACQTTTQTSVASDPTVDVGDKVVPVSRALQIFDAVCRRSQPDFASFDRNVKQLGEVRKASTGTVFSQTEDVSFKILDGPGGGKSCSMVYGTKESKRAVFRAYEARFTAIAATPLGRMGGYQTGDGVMQVIIGDPTRNDGLNYFNLLLLSEARNIRGL